MDGTMQLFKPALVGRKTMHIFFMVCRTFRKAPNCVRAEAD